MFGVSRMEGNTEHRPFLKKNPTSDIKTTYVVTDIGIRIIHTPSCEKNPGKNVSKYGIFKMMLNAERCSVLPSSTVALLNPCVLYDPTCTTGIGVEEVALLQGIGEQPELNPCVRYSMTPPVQLG